MKQSRAGKKKSADVRRKGENKSYPECTGPGQKQCAGLRLFIQSFLGTQTEDLLHVGLLGTGWRLGLEQPHHRLEMRLWSRITLGPLGWVKSPNET